MTAFFVERCPFGMKGAMRWGDRFDRLKIDPFDKLRAGSSLRQERSVQDDGLLTITLRYSIISQCYF
jgi:hypothetical protein